MKITIELHTTDPDCFAPLRAMLAAAGLLDDVEATPTAPSTPTAVDKTKPVPKTDAEQKKAAAAKKAAETRRKKKAAKEAADAAKAAAEPDDDADVAAMLGDGVDVTLDDLTAAGHACVKEHGAVHFKACFESLGITKISDLPEADYANALAVLTSAPE